MGVSFVSIFIVAYHLVFWVAGAAHSLSWDYLPGVPQGEEAERHVPWKEKPIGGWIHRRLGRKATLPSPDYVDSTEKNPDAFTEENEDKVDLPQILEPPPVEPRMLEAGLHEELDPDIQLARRSSRVSTTTFRTRQPSITPLSSPSSVKPPTRLGVSSPLATEPPVPLPPPTGSLSHPSSFKRFLRVLRPLSVVVTPITVTIAISLPIALIQDLKALFVDVSADGGPDWHGPDGRPPLAFVIDTGIA